MSDILEKTLELAKATDRPVKEICDAAGVKPRWYYRLLAGDFKEPGIAKIQRLYSVLKENKAA